MVLSVQNSTKTDEGCFEVLLDILNELLPYRVKEKLLSEMRKDLADHSGTSLHKALMIPASRPGTRFVVEDDRRQRIQQQGFLLNKYESSIKRYAHASAEKAVYEESLQNKTKESGRLRSNLDVLKHQSSNVSSQEIDNTVERLSACEMEMAELKERLEKLEKVIQEEDMQARRGKSVIMVGTKMTEEQFVAALREKEEEYRRLLNEREDELRRRMQEMNTKMTLMEKEYEHKNTEIRDLEHKVALQEKELQKKELELNKAKMRQPPAVLYHKPPAILSSLIAPHHETGKLYIRCIHREIVQYHNNIITLSLPEKFNTGLILDMHGSDLQIKIAII